MATLPPPAHLGPFMFHTLLDAVNDPLADLSEQRELLHTVVPMVHELGSAADGSAPDSSPLAAAVDGTDPDGGHAYVLDALRNFLLRCSLPSTRECEILLKTDVLSPHELRAAGKMSVEDRTSALAALVELAFVRGSLCDLLVAIRVMICVAWTNKMRATMLGLDKGGGAGCSNASTSGGAAVVGKPGAVLDTDDPLERALQKEQAIKGKKRVVGGGGGGGGGGQQEANSSDIFTAAEEQARSSSSSSSSSGGIMGLGGWADVA